MKKFEYVLCDLDGTLLNDEERHYYCYSEIIKKYGGIMLSSADYWFLKRNKVSRKILLEKSSFQGTYQQFLDEWVSIIESKDSLKHEFLKDNAVIFLKELIDVSEKLFLVTMRQNRENLLWQLGELNIKDYFDEIISQNPLVRNKIDAFPKEEYLGKKILVIGDTEADEELAQYLQADMLAFADGLREKKYIHANKYAYSMEEARHIILEYKH